MLRMQYSLSTVLTSDNSNDGKVYLNVKDKKQAT